MPQEVTAHHRVHVVSYNGIARVKTKTSTYLAITTGWAAKRLGGTVSNRTELQPDWLEAQQELVRLRGRMAELEHVEQHERREFESCEVCDTEFYLVRTRLDRNRSICSNQSASYLYANQNKALPLESPPMTGLISQRMRGR